MRCRLRRHPTTFASSTWLDSVVSGARFTAWSAFYIDFPDAPAEKWREAISAVAERIKAMPDAEILQLGGSHDTIRNLVADEMGLDGTMGRAAPTATGCWTSTGSE